MNHLVRRLAAECRYEAKVLRCGFVAAILAAWGCVFAGQTGWVIVLTCLGVFMAFIAGTLCHEARALDSLADEMEQEDEP